MFERASVECEWAAGLQMNGGPVSSMSLGQGTTEGEIQTLAVDVAPVQLHQGDIQPNPTESRPARRRWRRCDAPRGCRPLSGGCCSLRIQSVEKTAPEFRGRSEVRVGHNHRFTQLGAECLVLTHPCVKRLPLEGAAATQHVHEVEKTLLM